MHRLFSSRWGTLLLLTAAAPLASAQETPQQTAILDAVTRWKVINTAIFVAILAYFLWKYAPAFFNARSVDIQRAIKDATGLKIEAEFRYSEIDRKMATLPDEVARLRAQGNVEMQREHDRMRRETEAELAHIERNVAAEIEAFRQEGVREARQHTAQLALQSAERQLQSRFASGQSDELISDFIHLVERGKN